MLYTPRFSILLKIIPKIYKGDHMNPEKFFQEFKKEIKKLMAEGVIGKGREFKRGEFTFPLHPIV